jgi:hypothetical protein
MEAVWGFIGTLVGALASIGTTYITGRNAVILQTVTAERARDEQNRILQRETLLNLQDAVSDTLRLVARAHLEDRQAYRAGTSWGRNMLGEDIDEAMRISFRRVSLLTARVADDSLRQSVKGALAIADGVSHAADEKSAMHQFSLAMEAGGAIMESIGDCLRKQY